MNKIVIADKSNIVQHSLSMKLIASGFAIRVADSWQDLKSFFDNEAVDLVVMDAGFPHWKTVDAIRDLKREHPGLFIIITFKALTIPEIVDMVRNGADDCIPKPLDMAFLMERIRVLFSERDKDKQIHTKGAAGNNRGRIRYTQQVIVPTDEIEHMINLAKDRDVSVLLQGEAGVMKSAYAKYLHHLGNRRAYPFVTVECSDADGLESRLYGYEKANDAEHPHLVPGALSTVGQGTFLLKDIDCIPKPLQSGLVAVLFEKRFTPVGGHNSLPFSARIVATTNRNIEQLVEDGAFRQELFYVLSVVHIEIPPLRCRKEQLPAYITNTLGNLCRELNLPLPNVERDCLQQIGEYDWPGNEREFIYRMERALLMSEGGRFTVSLPCRNERLPEIGEMSFVLPEDNFSLKEYMQDKEDEVIRKVLKKFDGRRNKAASYLGISERTLRNKLNETQ